VLGAAAAPRPSWCSDHHFGGMRPILPPSRLDAPAPHPISPDVAKAPGLLPNSPAYPLYRWPLGRMLGDGLLVVNYVDLDASGGIEDYQGGPHSYDGHRGTDYLLHNFRLMDRGCPILAASSGTVAFMSSLAPGAFDRNCAFAPDEGTWLWIDNGDGSYSEYYHLRKFSLTVQVGEAVQAGQMLGLVGSSGYSTGPHLHFETGDYSSGPYMARDPYTGPSNPLPSLWMSQEDYQGDDPLHFVDMGVFTDAAVGGSVFNTTYCDVQEGIHSPTVFGITEPHLDLWVQFQGNAGDDFRLEIRRPNDSLWAAYDDVITYDAKFDWFWAYWFWNGNVAPADYGTWRIKAFANGSLSREMTFQVGPTTMHGPRLRPAGRSFRINGSTQRDTLRTTPLSPAVTYTLVGAPAPVSLAGAVLTIDATSTQPTRSAFFHVVATDGAARADTAWYHLVDMSKPKEPVTGVPDASISGALHLRVAPNPARAGTSLYFDIAESAPVNVDIFDVAGRQIRVLLSGHRPAGPYRLDWDGRDRDGREVSSGLYFVRIASGARSGIERLVVTR
jgi:murein DD-endopeptidase MepM/ murein hydrolase activator NlpD